MYWHSRSQDDLDMEKRKGLYSDENRDYKRAFHNAQDRYANVQPRDLSAVRRLAIKKMRFQGKRPELVAEAAAIRRIMEREVNR